jgi:signal recognition particle receptor subunit beta
MAQSSSANEVTARIVFWGAEGAGKSTSLRTIHGKLKAGNRGELKTVPTRLDPTVTYEEFPIALGTLNGRHTELKVLAVPGGPGLAPTRKQLLDCVDGMVLVLDAQADRLDENLASVAELRESLAAYGRRLEELPVVVQYNKRDLGDPFAIEEMHRQIRLPDAAVFETVATEGTGILQCLTTISKGVVRVLRERQNEPRPAAAVAEPVVATPSPAPAAKRAPAAPVRAADLMESAILSEGEAADSTIDDAQSALDRPWSELSAEAKVAPGARIGADLKVVSVGTASRAGHRGVQIPLVLGNDDGETVTLALTIQLDPLLEDDQE